jgi:hypothetical protein
MTKQILAAITAGALLLLTGCSVQINTSGMGGCRYSEDRSATVPAASAKNLNVEADAGFLHIVGKPDLTEVRVKGTACADKESVLQEIRLTTDTQGDTIIVRGILPDSWGIAGNRSLDMTLEVPEGLALDLRDDSGETSIKGVASATVRDDSGDLEVMDVKGDVDIVDDSGSIVVRGIGGLVKVDDQSGDLTVEDVAGGVTVRDDSGSIIVRRIGGSVEIPNDDSGDIEVGDVAGSVTIDRDDSGSIDVTNVKGDFTVKADGSGSIGHNNIGGTVSLPPKH